MQRAVLILDPPDGCLSHLQPIFDSQTRSDCNVHLVKSLNEIVEHLTANNRFHSIVLHREKGDGHRSGIALIPHVRKLDSALPIVVVDEQGDVQSVADAIDQGATDFLVIGKHLEQRVDTCLGKLRGLFEMFARNQKLNVENEQLREVVEPKLKLVGCSKELDELNHRIRRVATIPRPVLIVGERGTGKELVARAIHDVGGDEQRPIVTVNCAAFSDSLLESELFGHEKGAFTGAESVRRGKFELADGGTLFLDEIGHMSLSFQQKILRVVEYGHFTRVGGSSELRTTARIIAATNADLKSRMKEGQFLRDLYDRLTFEIVRVPPLRERTDDIRSLAQHFLDQFAAEIPAFQGKVLSKSAIEFLLDYQFPGNVRELKNIIERAAYRDVTNEITPEDIGMLSNEEIGFESGNFTEKVDAYQKRLLRDALEKSKGNGAEAARILGVSYHKFRYYKKSMLDGADD